jgi:hypothetical protein
VSSGARVGRRLAGAAPEEHIGEPEADHAVPVRMRVRVVREREVGSGP